MAAESLALSIVPNNTLVAAELADARKQRRMNPEHQPPAPSRKPASKTAVNPADTARLNKIGR